MSCWISHWPKKCEFGILADWVASSSISSYNYLDRIQRQKERNEYEGEEEEWLAVVCF